MEVLVQIKESALTSLGLFWMAFWAFGLGYLVSSMIQVFVTKEKMKSAMGESSVKSIGLGTFFGFISSSCSFAALSTSRALFVKGASLIPSLAFLLASTNLVVELGIVISMFLGWQFVVGEYVGGILLILSMWILVKFTLTNKLEKQARSKADKDNDKDEAKSEDLNFVEKLKSKESWSQVFKNYLMEWSMVWKDVTIGFTVAGFIATFVPKTFFETLFIGSGLEDPSFLHVLAQAAIGPVAAFFTFIGSMGNIPLAAVLFNNGVSFAGVMAFIFSDLVVLPVLRIQAKYYGKKMALYIAVVFFISLVISSILLHYGFYFFDLLPELKENLSLMDRTYFKLDSNFYFNIIFLALSVFFFIKSKKKLKLLKFNKEPVLNSFLMLSILWIFLGLVLNFYL